MDRHRQRLLLRGRSILTQQLAHDGKKVVLRMSLELLESTKFNLIAVLLTELDII
eukprot:CAMPEP_0117079200 /NCGR_PEP_ID=MMETSP0472-20121206/55876_1 /TAXON_ID=693140 ORGANISM="Tiarina fusus, Strain LIS" /NCGR_SAMPLE_ID=MMETSP0472 /ASSEMBLY_ACC=CAM_ASM_000603 /LENGTH=54 /DNA_ID=CAMNT_0004806323 /DNA_START=47 /DNA_END=208 /DNA_ORIENTATION=-